MQSARCPGADRTGPARSAPRSPLGAFRRVPEPRLRAHRLPTHRIGTLAVAVLRVDSRAQVRKEVGSEIARAGGHRSYKVHRLRHPNLFYEEVSLSAKFPKALSQCIRVGGEKPVRN